jgi:ABC-type nitrate/sulfonate/bicarbonate transport system substrate-binding protein
MRRAVIAIAFIGLALWCCRQHATDNPPLKRELRHVDFLIDWQAEPSYLGIYYAQATGKFRAIGADVAIIQSWGANQAAKAIGSNRYLIGTASGGATVLAKSAGNDLVSLGVIYPRISTVVYGLGREHVLTPRDLIGKRIGIYPNSITKNEFDALLNLNNVALDKVDVVSLSGPDIPLILSGRVDGVLHYSEMSPALLAVDRQRSVQHDGTFELPLADYGVAGYGINVITSRTTYNEERGFVTSIARAVFEGYRDGCKNREDAIRVYMKEFPDKDPAYVRESWDRVCKIIGPNPGMQTAKGWRETIGLYQSLGLLRNPVTPESLLP